MTQPTLASFLSKSAVSAATPTLPPTTSPAPERSKKRCARPSQDLNSRLQSGTNSFHSSCHAPAIEGACVCCVRDSPRAPKRPRRASEISRPLKTAKVVDLDVKIPETTLMNGQIQLRNRENELKQISLARNKELASIVGVSDDRKICPVFLKPSERTILPSVTTSLAPLSGCDPLVDVTHHNPCLDLPLLHSSFPPASFAPFTCEISQSLLRQTRPTSLREKVWVPVSSGDVENRKLRKLQNSVESEITSSTSAWLAGRLDEDKDVVKRVTKFLGVWKEDERKAKKRKSALFVISGASGTGKTSLVHAAAADCCFNVLEIWEISDLKTSEEALYSKNVDPNRPQVILINDLDVILANDRYVANQVASFIRGARRPVVVTTSSALPENLHSLAREIGNLEAPSIEAVALTTHLRLGLSLRRSLALARHFRGDFRQVLLMAQTLKDERVEADPFEFSGLEISRALEENSCLEEEVKSEIFWNFLEFALEMGVQATHLVWLDRNPQFPIDDLFPGVLYSEGDFSQTAVVLAELNNRRAKLRGRKFELQEMVQAISGSREWLRARWDRRAAAEVVGALSLAAKGEFCVNAQRHRQYLFGTIDFTSLQVYPRIR